MLLRECTICPGHIGTTERCDKEFCSDACRSLNWQRKNRVPISTYTVEDFAEVHAVLARTEARLERKSKLIGYSLRAHHPKRELARLGEVEFPDPGRKTKRFPDESGVTHVRRERFFRNAPFEPPRVPETGIYRVTVYFADGSVQTVGELITVGKAFPSVLYYDKEGNRYDVKGKMTPKGKPATPKARRKYVPRKHSTPNDSVVPVEPTILEHIRVAVARAVQAEREVDRLRGQATPPPDNREQAVTLGSFSEQVAILTAKLTAAETRAKEQISQAEARAARAEAQLAHSSNSDTVRFLEAQVQQTALRASAAEDALYESRRERGRLAQQIEALERSQRQSAVASVPTGTTASVAPTVASKPATVQQSSAAAPSTPAPVKPATVPSEQSVTRSVGQSATPPAAVKPAVLHRKTLSILKPGGGRI